MGWYGSASLILYVDCFPSYVGNILGHLHYFASSMLVYLQNLLFASTPQLLTYGNILGKCATLDYTLLITTAAPLARYADSVSMDVWHI